MNAISSISLCARGLLVTATLLLPTAGCRLCCDLEDAEYPAFGGTWTRTDRDSGRVGSVFDPGGALSPQTLTPRSAVDEKRDEERFRDAPQKEQRDSSGSSSLVPEPQRDSESDEEFEKRKKRFEAEMLNTGVILGPPAPPRI